MQNLEMVKEAGRYYTEKFKEHREGPLAAGWNLVEAQNIRFAQLSRLLPQDRTKAFSLCDFGSGLGDYQVYLESDYPKMSYTGIDVSAEIIERAKRIRGVVNIFVIAPSNLHMTISLPVGFLMYVKI